MEIVEDDYCDILLVKDMDLKIIALNENEIHDLCFFDPLKS